MAKEVKKDTIHADGIDIGVYTTDYVNEYISLTDIAKRREGEYPGYVIQNWMRSRSTVSFIGLWEILHNSNFNCLEFEAIKNDAGENSFVMTPKRWIESTGAIGVVSKQGRYAATYAHRDIAFEFASWISPEFKLYIIGTIRDLNRMKISYKYANEADLLNVALFGKTARQWRDSNPEKKGNMRDEADLNQLLVLANMESYNAILIEQGRAMSDRLILLRELAVKQMKTLAMVSMDGLKQLPGGGYE